MGGGVVWYEKGDGFFLTCGNYTVMLGGVRLVTAFGAVFGLLFSRKSGRKRSSGMMGSMRGVVVAALA